MNRRQFGAAMAAVGLTSVAKAGGPATLERLQLARNGWMPNNEHLPVLLYRGAFHASAASNVVASEMEAAFERNTWPAQWRNGVYRYHHYHSTAHEVLGFAGGSARIMFGGEGGLEITVNAGDVAVLPTGTGHCLLEEDSRFLVVGAYPRYQHWDICRAAPDAVAVERMRRLPFPKSDPVHGATGDLVQAWSTEPPRASRD